MERTGRNSVLYLAGALMQGLGIFLVQPFALRVLNNDAEWQELFLAVSVIQIGVVLGAAGLPLAITKTWFDNNGAAKARSISGFLSLFGAVVGILAAAVYWWVARGREGTFSFTIALLTMGLLATVLAAQALLRAQGRPVAFVLLSLGSSVAAYGAGLLAMLLVSATASVFMVGFGAAVCLTALGALFVAPPSQPFAVHGAAKEALLIGLPVLPHTGSMMLLTQGAAFLLAAVAAEGVSGDYGKVQIFVLGTVTLLGALNNAWVPAIMSAKPDERPERMRSVMKTASLAGLAIVVVASGGANVVTHVMAVGREDLIPVAQIMPLIALGYLLYLNASSLLFADKVTWILAVVTPSVLIISTLAALWPASSGNLVLMAATSAGSFFLLGGVYFLVARRRAPGGWPMRTYALCCLAAIAYVVVLLMVPRDIVSGLITAGVLAVASGCGLALWQQRRAKRTGKASQ
ncbi:lipopolysaccharide biosynthesis protein [Arthrobacter sp. UC242_113]|uniref:lipopolysaccharide biosynthesis protein n=1 Tax=Arthrobacter sp. UC242_113 TaxID=3374550 RepID=UPI0037565BDE